MFSFPRLAFALALSTFTLSVTADKVFDGDNYATKIDYQPPFVKPAGGEVFFAGQTIDVQWDQTLDYNLTDVANTADIVLGYKTEGSSSLNLLWSLKTDVPLYKPNPDTTTVVLPASSANLTTRDSYILVLLGSTNNQSPEFTIVASNIDLSGEKRQKARLS